MISKMKKIIFLLILLINTGLLFSIDYYAFNYNTNLRYAIAITPSNNFENEYIVGLLEIDSWGDERWTISTRTLIDDNRKLQSAIDLNFPVIRFRENHIDIEINKNDNVVLQLNRVDSLSYKNCTIILPEVFYY